MEKKKEVEEGELVPPKAEIKSGTIISTSSNNNKLKEKEKDKKVEKKTIEKEAAKLLGYSEKEKKITKEESRKKDKEKEREREREKEKEKEREREREKERSRSRKKSSKKKKKHHHHRRYSSESSSPRRYRSSKRNKDRKDNKKKSRHRDRKREKAEQNFISIGGINLMNYNQDKNEDFDEKVDEDNLLREMTLGQENEEKKLKEMRKKRQNLIEELNEKKNENEEKIIEEKNSENNDEIAKNNFMTPEKIIEENNNTPEKVKRKDSQKKDQEKNSYYRLIDDMRKRFEDDEETETKKEEEENKNEKNEKNEEKKVENDVFDMFGDEELPNNLDEQAIKPSLTTHALEWDDEENYLIAKRGDILNKQYKVIKTCGKGVFSTVVQAENIINKQEVAIKILRSDEILLRAGERERNYLKMLNESDRSEKRHVIKLHGSFEYRKHLCLVFEFMDRDLRETIKIYGKRVGLSLEAVRSYSKQIFVALNHLKKNKLIHADIKPDNVLICNNNKTVKLCDFGTAFPFEESFIVEYLQSRYYRAPEVILGCSYDNCIDIWSAACTIYELFTGNFLFPGRNNNEMLKLIMQTKGKFSNKILRKGEYVSKYFDTNYNFLSYETDPITKQGYYKPISISDKPTKDLLTLLTNSNVENSMKSQKELNLLKDFLEKSLALDPSKRMTIDEALRHPFINPFDKFKTKF